MNLARFVGVFSAFAVVGSKLARWAKERHESRQVLPLDAADLTEVATIPPPAPRPIHHPRVPSLSRPDVHAFEVTSVAQGPLAALHDSAHLR